MEVRYLKHPSFPSASSFTFEDICKDYKFRDGPVPRTGGGGRKFRNWFVHPRTTQERRHEDEFTRGKRRNLPTAWDDQTRSDCRWNKPVSWKHNRKTQWK